MCVWAFVKPTVAELLQVVIKKQFTPNHLH